MRKNKLDDVIGSVREKFEKKDIVPIQEIKHSINENCGTDPKTIRSNLKALYELGYLKHFLTAKGKISKKLVILTNKVIWTDYGWKRTDSVDRLLLKKRPKETTEETGEETEEETKPLITSIPKRERADKDTDEEGQLEEEQPEEENITGEELWGKEAWNNRKTED